MALTETERMISFYPQGETFLRHDEVFFECLVRLKDRGVLFDTYCLGVTFENSQIGMGMTAPESDLSQQTIRISQLAWIEAITKKMPINDVLETIIEHEFIHEVHRSRVARGLTNALEDDALEFVVHSVQLSPFYIKSRQRHWSKKVLKWLRGINRSWAEDETLSEHTEVIGSEFRNAEYLFALGL